MPNVVSADGSGYEECLVLIPAYNEEATISAVISQARKALPGAEILVINDCSRDLTSARAKEAGARVLDLTFNLGIGGAVQAGYRYALEKRFSIVARLDGDGQHPARFLPQMIAVLREWDVDVVIGSRFLDKALTGYRSNLFRRLGILYLRCMLRLLLKLSITDPTSGFRVSGPRVIELAARHYPREYPEPESLVLWSRRRFRIKEHPVSMLERQAGHSTIGKLSTVYYFFKVSISVVLAWMIRDRS